VIPWQRVPAERSRGKLCNRQKGFLRRSRGRGQRSPKASWGIPQRLVLSMGIVDDEFVKIPKHDSVFL
jgi:hypothetical protein